jgi:hypothetical protein
MQKIADDAAKFASVLAGMFTDPRFREFRPYRWYGEIDGIKVGVVAATRKAGFDTHALNKSDLELLIAAKREGKVDQAFVVAANIDGFNNLAFVDFADAENLFATLLQRLRPRIGARGEFWILTPTMIATGSTDPNDEPF